MTKDDLFIESYIKNATEEELKFIVKLNVLIESHEKGLLTEGIWDDVKSFFGFAGDTLTSYFSTYIVKYILNSVLGVNVNSLLGQILSRSLSQIGVDEIKSLLFNKNEKSCAIIAKSLIDGTIKGISAYGETKFIGGLLGSLGVRGNGLVGEFAQTAFAEWIAGGAQKTESYAKIQAQLTNYFCSTDFVSLIGKTAKRAMA